MNLYTQALLSQSNPDIRLSEQLFLDALKIDPEYALAYAGLAWLYIHHSVWTGDPESYEKAILYSETAYEMGPETGISMAVKAYKENREGNYEDALRLLRSAISLNPNHAEIRAITGFTLRQLGLYDRAVHHLEKAIDLNPFYLIQYGALFMAYYMNGDYEQAIPYMEKVIELNPNVLRFVHRYTIALVMAGRHEEVEPMLKSWEENYPESATGNWSRGFLLARQGMKEEALSKARTESIYITLGMEEEAIDYIKRRIHTVRDYPYLHLKNNPLYDPLRDNTEFNQILEERKKVYQAVLKAAEGL
jgi:tetratricopeptide (TPR) repeat protein